MANAYKQMKDRHQNEISNFPVTFAFNDEQWVEAMKTLGLTMDDMDKIY